MDLENSCHIFCLVSKSCPTLCNAVDCSMPGSQSSITGVCSNSCPMSQWCYLTISSSAAPFSFCLQSFPASGSFPMCWLFTSYGRIIGASASASILPMNTHCWFPLGLTGLTSLIPRDSQESSPASQFESISSLAPSLLYGPTLTSVHDYWKNHSFDYMDLCKQTYVSAFLTCCLGLS